MGGTQIAPDVKAAQSIVPQSSSATVNGAAVDTASFDEAMIVFDVGTTLATGTLDVTVEEADATGGPWTAITGAVFAQVTPTNDNAIFIGTIRMEAPRKQFLRAVGVAAVAASVYGVSIHLGQAVSLPAQTPVFDV